MGAAGNIEHSPSEITARLPGRSLIYHAVSLMFFFHLALEPRARDSYAMPSRVVEIPAPNGQKTGSNSQEKSQTPRAQPDTNGPSVSLPGRSSSCCVEFARRTVDARQAPRHSTSSGGNSTPGASKWLEYNYFWLARSASPSHGHVGGDGGGVDGE